jgi:hypothetical protein
MKSTYFKDEIGRFNLRFEGDIANGARGPPVYSFSGLILLLYFVSFSTLNLI